MRLGLALVAVAALAAVPAATGALGVATGVTAASLRVDAAGNAQVSWTTRGSQRTVVVTAQGTIATGRTLVGADVSKPLRGTHVPFQQAIRSGPGGWYYALQARRTEAAGPMSLRFSRWRGVPTEASLRRSSSTRASVSPGRRPSTATRCRRRWRTVFAPRSTSASGGGGCASRRCR